MGSFEVPQSKTHEQVENISSTLKQNHG